MNIQSVRKTVSQNNIGLSLFEDVEGIPSKIEFQQAFAGRSSVVISPGREERYNGQGKNDEILFHSFNLLPKEKRLKRTKILISLSSLLQRIFESGSLTMGAIGFDGA